MYKKIFLPFFVQAHMCVLFTITHSLTFSGCTSSSTVREPSVSSRSTPGTLFVKMQSQAYTIKEGDKIDLSVWDYPEFNTTATVNANGTIPVPLVGDLKAAGLTKDDFSAFAKKKFTEYVKGEPRLTVSISSPTAQKVAVIGAVTRQDNYAVTSEVSLLEILSSAGGATPESDLTHVRIIRFRGNQDPVEVNLADAMETGEVETLPKVRPGDTIYIPKKENFVRSFSDFLRDAVLLLGFFRVLY